MIISIGTNVHIDYGSWFDLSEKLQRDGSSVSKKESVPIGV